MNRLAVFTVAMICLLASPLWAQPKAPTPSAAALSGKEIFQQTLKSTVWVLRAEEYNEGDKRGIRTSGMGSGSLIDLQNRLVVTNYHVVRDSKLAIIFFPAFDKQKQLIPERDHYLRAFKAGGGIRATVIASDPKVDLALIQLPKDSIPAGTPALKIARESVSPGDQVHSIGNPGASGALWVYTPGGVKAVYKKEFTTGSKTGSEEKFKIDARVVETTSPVNPGDSGGPVVNGQGELVAVTQGHASDDSARAISYFIDISELKNLLKKNNFTKVLAATSAPAIAASTQVEQPKAAPPMPSSPQDEKARKEKAAAQKLELARQFEGTPEKYRSRLNDIIKDFPGTEAAIQAKELLEKIK